MYTTININTFRDAFDKVRPDNFSYAGLEALYDYLEDYHNIELDVIALCCDFTESTIEEALEDYSLDSLEELRDNTLVIRVSDERIIYQNY